MNKETLTPDRLRTLLATFKERHGSEYGLCALGYFGSFARDTATPAGVWVSAVYWLLREERNEKSAAKQAIRFGVLVFGGYWLVYNLFVLIFVRVPILDVFVRVLIDITSVTVSIWVAKALGRRAVTQG